MKPFKTILVVLLEVLFLGAFIACFPLLIQVFANSLTAVLVVGIMIAGGVIVVGMGFHKSRRSTKRNGVD